LRSTAGAISTFLTALAYMFMACCLRQ
jgi:hypothetical protein